MSVCKRCDDTHIHWDSGLERSVMCCYCPIPCDNCKDYAGAYCKNTPCDCACHQRQQNVAAVTGPSYYLEGKILQVLVSEIGIGVVISLLNDIVGNDSMINFVRNFIKEIKNK